jgi:hypothetical protein
MMELLKPRLNKLETNVGNMRDQIDTLGRNLDMDVIKEKDNDGTTSIKDYIRNITNNMKSVSDKVEKVINKQENMNQEIIHKVRKDLTIDSRRIMDEFKTDLKSSIVRIEDKLREKVDKYNLDEVYKNLDDKFISEISKKIDLSDLKRNNNQIVRKIDNLENRISKTLVDTLIDLQMEEAPLLIKKSVNGDRCASCNQVIKEPHSHSHLQTSTDCNIPTKASYRNISRDEEPKRMLTTSSNYYLPEVKNKKPNRLLKTDEDTQKQLINMLDEELEKKIVNPGNIVRGTNRIFDKLERKYNK